ncbi:uncharacterized protein LOC113293420 [Papaver somniferum]|uniref:uncharacterized protein LOC113293420 n=1 Tax=Papaver somniferum TaxID=3469 RepID=UPI000E6FAF76|nr:uncharacterized protein LOC113293420 [Papaver somniferum]
MLDTDSTPVEDTNGEPSGKETEADLKDDLDVDKEPESSQLTLSLSDANPSILENMGFGAGLEAKRIQEANLQVSNVIAQIANSGQQLEEENEVNEGERSTNKQEAKMVATYTTSSFSAPSFHAITAGIFNPPLPEMEDALTQETEYTPTQQTEEGDSGPADNDAVLEGLKVIYKLEQIDGTTEEEDTTQDDDDSEATQSESIQCDNTGREARYNTRSSRNPPNKFTPQGKVNKGKRGAKGKKKKKGGGVC